MMASKTVIVFGATGQVASMTARTAQREGAKVFLALRDIHKPIPGLSSDEERAAGFERVQADLTQPNTVHAAASRAGATHAFIYRILAAEGHLRASIEALKSAGVDFVVFLSGMGLPDNLRAVSSDQIIAYLHAQVEINLHDIYGAGGFVAVRPGSFASNSAQWKSAVAGGDQVVVVCPEVKWDWIVPDDIGRVCGNLLAHGAQDLDIKAGQTHITLCGPELISQEDALLIIGKAVGKNLKITSVSEDKRLRSLMGARGLPEPVARALLQALEGMAKGQINFFEENLYREGVANVERYSRRPATTLQEWIEDNKQLFAA